MKERNLEYLQVIFFINSENCLSISIYCSRVAEFNNLQSFSAGKTQQTGKI